MIELPTKLQIEMMQFFLKTSVPRIIAKMNNNIPK